jgi:peroxiredoxin
LADFDTNAALLGKLGVTVVAASVDSLADTIDVVTRLQVRYVKVLAELDGPAVAESTGAFLQTGKRTFLHATGFLLDPTGAIVNAVYSTGPIGRFTANDVLKKVAFEQARSTG